MRDTGTVQLRCTSFRHLCRHNSQVEYRKKGGFIKVVQGCSTAGAELPAFRGDIQYLLEKSPILPKGVLMDKGFDSNPLHESLRDKGVWSIAPVRKGCKRGQYRRQLRDYFDWGLYWQRNIVECLFSAIKRLFGVHIRARTWHAQRAEINSKFIAYNIKAILNHYFLHSPNTHLIFKCVYKDL